MTDVLSADKIWWELSCETGNMVGAKGEPQRVALGWVPCTNTSLLLQEWHKLQRQLEMLLQLRPSSTCSIRIHIFFLSSFISIIIAFSPSPQNLYLLLSRFSFLPPFIFLFFPHLLEFVSLLPSSAPHLLNPFSAFFRSFFHSAFSFILICLFVCLVNYFPIYQPLLYLLSLDVLFAHVFCFLSFQPLILQDIPSVVTFLPHPDHLSFSISSLFLIFSPYFHLCQRFFLFPNSFFYLPSFPHISSFFLWFVLSFCPSKFLQYLLPFLFCPS